MMAILRGWGPAIILAAGALFTVGLDGQRTMALRAPLDQTIPKQMEGQVGSDVTISKEEQRVAGMTSYVMRVYSPTGNLQDQIAAKFSVYVGYYSAQMRGKTIHSPKNCLPGSGWEALTSAPATIATAAGPITVNRYLLKRGKEQALVLYWYQGRGRVEANEYRVKWDLLRDAAIKRRTDEALVRIVVPTTISEEEAFREAARVAAQLLPAVNQAMPDRDA
ncbi:MAG TPA: EpsI family protein [Longimicrobiales bacterium]